MILAKNKKALFDYEPLEKLEAGIVLTGPEVKAAKKGQINLKGSYVTFQKGELFLKEAYIAPYLPAKAQQRNYDPLQPRKILLHKKELRSWQGKVAREHLTIIPFSVYTKNNLIKVELVLARGKRKYEKRELLKKRAQERRIREVMKQRAKGM